MGKMEGSGGAVRVQNDVNARRGVRRRQAVLMRSEGGVVVLVWGNISRRRARDDNRNVKNFGVGE